jgi:hypothetical protein
MGCIEKCQGSIAEAQAQAERRWPESHNRGHEETMGGCAGSESEGWQSRITIFNIQGRRNSAGPVTPTLPVPPLPGLALDEGQAGVIFPNS